MIGGSGDDRLIGSGALDYLWPGPGRDIVRGRGGSDHLGYDGFSGTSELVFHTAATRGLHVNLTTGVAFGQGFDRLFGIENVSGSDFGDVLVGNRLANALGGNGGSDLLRGRRGNDGLSGLDGRDELHGGNGRDQLSGNGGRDVAYGNRGDDTFLMVEAYSGEEPRRDVLWGGPGSDFAERDDLDILHSIEHAPPPG